MRLLPGGPEGTTDSQGQWSITMPEGTYTVEARRESTVTTFFGVRLAAGKAGDARLALSCRERGARVARARSNAAGG